MSETKTEIEYKLVCNLNLLDLPKVPLDICKFNFLYNKTLLDNLIKNPKDDEDNYIVNLGGNELNALKNLRKSLKGNLSYEYVQNNAYKYGRVYHSSFILGISSVLRKTLTYDYYYEFDISNCQPTVLREICIYHNIECNLLKLFIRKREKLIEEYSLGGVSRLEAKEKLLTLLYDSNITHHDEIFHPLHKEIHQDIIPKLKIIYKDLNNYCKNLKKYKGDTSFLSWLLSTVENRIITIAKEFCDSKSIKVGLIIHDAILIDKFKFKFEELVLLKSELIEFIKLKYHNFDIEFKLSDFKSETLPNHETLKEDTKQLDEFDIINGYYEYSKEFGSKIMLISDIFYCCDKNNIWIENNLSLVKDILLDLDFKDYLQQNYNNYIQFRKYKQWLDLFSLLKIDNRFKLPKDFDFNKKAEVLAFSNCKCIQLNKLDKDKPWFIRDILPNDFITMTTKFPLNFDSVNKDEYKSLITNMFQDSETAESYLYILGSSLYGELLVKHFFICKGAGDDGKSFGDKRDAAVFGDYYGTFNSDFFISSDFGGDIKNPEAIANKYKRFISCQEPTALRNYKKTSFNLELIKAYSGGDMLKARLLGQNIIVNFINIASLMINLNNLLQFVNLDTAGKNRIKIIPKDITFVDNPTRDNECKKISDSSFFKLDSFKNSMMLLYLEYWSKFVRNNLNIPFSQQIIDYTNEHLDDKIDRFISLNYLKTEDKKDYIHLDEMYQLYIESELDKEFLISEKTFKEKLNSKRFNVKKIDKPDSNGKRCQKLGMLYLKKRVIHNDRDNDPQIEPHIEQKSPDFFTEIYYDM